MFGNSCLGVIRCLGTVSRVLLGQVTFIYIALLTIQIVTSVWEQLLGCYKVFGNSCKGVSRCLGTVARVLLGFCEWLLRVSVVISGC